MLETWARVSYSRGQEKLSINWTTAKLIPMSAMPTRKKMLLSVQCCLLNYFVEWISICFALSAVDNNRSWANLSRSPSVSQSHRIDARADWVYENENECVLKWALIHSLAIKLRGYWLCTFSVHALSSLLALLHSLRFRFYLRKRFIGVIVRYRAPLLFAVTEADAAHLSTSFIRFRTSIVTVV